VDTAEKLVSELQASTDPIAGRVGRIRRYLLGRHDLPYIPNGATSEYRHMALKSITNWLPQVANTYTQGLFVDGYRRSGAADNAAPWQIWQDNGMDARQTIVIRSALEYGVGYGVTLPGDSSPVMRAYTAERAIAWYDDEDDEWPTCGLIHKGTAVDGSEIYHVLDDENVYLMSADGGAFKVVDQTPHGLGVTPMIRFRTRLGEKSRGIIEPLIPIQDQVNETMFNLRMAMQYASFRQRWATGLAIPLGDNGEPVEPFDAAVDRLWVTDNAEAKFGDFSQTQTADHLQAYLSQVRTLAGQAQVSPNILTGDLVNLSADALAQLRSQTELQLGEFRTILGESFEQWFRLSALAAGDLESAQDSQGEVRWRDTEPRSLESTVQALGEMVDKLGIPAKALWDKVPGFSDQDIERFENEAASPDGIDLLMQQLARQEQPTTDLGA